MIYALNPTRIVQWISLLTFFAAVGAVALSSPQEAHHLWGLKTYVLAVPSALIFLLTLRPIFRWVHRVSFASHWMFPLLDGRWEGEVHSNWPRIQAMMLAARGEAAPFNALSDETPGIQAVPAIAIAAKIESGLFDYRIILTMSETRQSRTVFVKPERKPGERPRLYYIYQQQEHGPVEVTDRAQHQGAAYLDYDAETEILTGAYWTERQSELGLNTAGRIRLWRKTKGGERHARQ